MKYGFQALCTLSMLCLVSDALYAQSFTPLGDLPGVNFSSLASGVSADGAVVVGVSNTDLNGANFAAFRWENGVMANLGDHLMRGSVAVGVSADGSIIAGESIDARNDPVPVRWVDGTLELLAIPGGEFRRARVRAISGDGTVIVGQHTDTAVNAIKWVQGEPSLLPSYEGHTNAIAYDVANDGSPIVGQGDVSFGTPHAVMWFNGGTIASDIHPPGWDRSSAQAVSADGNVIVGWVERGAAPNVDRKPFRWENGTLSVLETPGYATATAVSGDGSVVIGYDSSIPAPAIWTADDGWRNLITVSTEQQIDLQGFTQFYPPTAISDDGLTIAGSGVNAAGFNEAYLLKLAGPSQEDLVVNDTRDLEDDSASDEVCDVDANEAGEQCTLRAAIQEANRRGGGTITFDLPGSAVPSIQIGDVGLPPVESRITLDATTQSGGWVELVGPGVESASEITGIEIASGGGGSIVRGLVIHGFRKSGIALASGADGNVIEGNRIGTDVTGTLARGNGMGTSILPYSDFNFDPTVGGINWPGLLIESSNNRIEGNTIAGNYGPSLFSGNTGVDVLILPYADTNVLVGNRIGVGVDDEPIALPTPSDLFDIYIGLWILGAKNNHIGEGGEPGGPTSCQLSTCNRIAGHQVEIRLGTRDSKWPVPTSGTLITGNVIGKRLPTRGMQTNTGIQSWRAQSPQIANNSIYGFTHGVVLEETEGAVVQGNFITSDELKVAVSVERESQGALRTGLFFSGRTTVHQNRIVSPSIAVLANPGDVITNNTLSGGSADVSVYTFDESTSPSARISQNTHSSSSTRMESIFLGGVDYQGGAITPRPNRYERRNDWLDTDGYQNAPVISFAKREGTAVTVGGTLRSNALASSYLIEAFACEEIGRFCTLTYIGKSEIIASIPYTGFRFTLPDVPAGIKYLGFTATREDNAATSEMVGGPTIVSTDAFSEAEIRVAPGSQVSAQGMTLTLRGGPEKRARHTPGDTATVFVTRYDLLPDTSMYAEASAMSSSGALVQPSAVAARTWYLGELGLSEQTRGPDDAIPFDLCFDASDVVVATALESVVVMQRPGGAALAWQPLATDLLEENGTPYLCAGGLRTLGEFGFGGEAMAFPVVRENETGEWPASIELSSAYPNPFQASTTFTLSMPLAGFASIRVYDVVGRHVATLFEGGMNAGTHIVRFDADRFASGVYFIRAEAHGVGQTRSVTLMR
ncbi:MAG: T9SS type A sorting domain-containing protein [Rhodothermales bacterium]